MFNAMFSINPVFLWLVLAAIIVRAPEGRRNGSGSLYEVPPFVSRSSKKTLYPVWRSSFRLFNTSDMLASVSMDNRASTFVSAACSLRVRVSLSNFSRAFSGLPASSNPCASVSPRERVSVCAFLFSSFLMAWVTSSKVLFVIPYGDKIGRASPINLSRSMGSGIFPANFRSSPVNRLMFRSAWGPVSGYLSRRSSRKYLKYGLASAMACSVAAWDMNGHPRAAIMGERVPYVLQT